MSRLLAAAGPEQQRLATALAVALAVHVLVFLGIHFSLPQPVARQPVYSLHLALKARAGGDPKAEPGALPAPSSAVAGASGSARAPTPASAEFSAVSSTQGNRPAPPPAGSRAAARAVFPQQTDGLIPLGARSALIPETLGSGTLAGGSKPSHLSARARLAGVYAERWRERVQRIATRHFPVAALQRGLGGRLTLDVAIRADGSLYSIRLLRSSGHQVLDAAARRIVLLASPFAPFPPALRKRYDILHIVRTWEFAQGRRPSATK